MDKHPLMIAYKAFNPAVAAAFLNLEPSRTGAQLSALFIDLNGRFACEKHIGMEASAELARRPKAKTIRTSMTEWDLVSPAFRAEFERSATTAQCEACGYSTTTVQP